ALDKPRAERGDVGERLPGHVGDHGAGGDLRGRHHRGGAIRIEAAPIRRCETTGPPFCAIPVWSTLATSMPSRLAAVERTCPTVTTPVPPMPAINNAAWSGRVGSGSERRSRRDRSCTKRVVRRFAFGTTV